MDYKNPLIKKAVSIFMMGMAFLIFSCQTNLMRGRSEKLLTGYPAAVADYEAGRYEKALETFNGILRGQPDHPQIQMIKYYQAFCNYYIGDYKNSIILATNWLKNYPDNPERYKIQRLAGDANRESGNMYDACFWMLVSLKTAGDTGISQYIQDIIADSVTEIISKSSEDDLKKIKDLHDIKPFLGSIYLRKAEIALEKEDFSDANNFANLSIQSATENEQGQLIIKGREFLDLIKKSIEEKSEINRKTIGCLLPLEGPYSLYGEEMLSGIQLGMDIFNNSNTGISLELVIKNTNASPEDTLAAIDELIFKENVVAIIGPLAESASVTAAKKAQEYGVPIITFTQKQDITEEGDMVFRNYLTPSKEMDVLINKVVYDMGMSQFGIFYPDTSYGNYFMNLFWDKVEKTGGEITAVESYKTDETDYADGIKKMVGLYYPRPESIIERLKNKKMGIVEGEASAAGPENLFARFSDFLSTTPGEEEYLANPPKPADHLTEQAKAEGMMPFFLERTVKPYPSENPDDYLDEEMIEEEAKTDPIVDFDAVFIPGNSDNIALIAPQFPFYNVFLVPFLGTSLWLSDNLINTTSEYLQGAIFPVGFYVNNDSEKVRDFVGMYRDTYSRDPGILAATGFDTIKIIKKLISDNYILSRSDFQKALLGYDKYEGVTGHISFDEQGEVEKSPLLLTVHGRRLHILQ